MTKVIEGIISGVATEQAVKELEGRISQLEMRLAGLELRLQMLIEGLRKGHLQEVDDLERVGMYKTRTAELRKAAKEATRLSTG